MQTKVPGFEKCSPEKIRKSVDLNGFDFGRGNICIYCATDLKAKIIFEAKAMAVPTDNPVDISGVRAKPRAPTTTTGRLTAANGCKGVPRYMYWMRADVMGSIN